MASSLAERLNGIPRKSLVMRGETARVQGETDHKRLVVKAEDRARVAQWVTAIFANAKISRKDAAYQMGYGEDQSPITRWTAGVEPPQMWRILLVRELRVGMMLASAELDGDVEIRTVVSLRRIG